MWKATWGNSLARLWVHGNHTWRPVTSECLNLLSHLPGPILYPQTLLIKMNITTGYIVKPAKCIRKKSRAAIPRRRNGPFPGASGKPQGLLLWKPRLGLAEQQVSSGGGTPGRPEGYALGPPLAFSRGNPFCFAPRQRSSSGGPSTRPSTSCGLHGPWGARLCLIGCYVCQSRLAARNWLAFLTVQSRRRSGLGRSGLRAELPCRAAGLVFRVGLQAVGDGGGG